MLRTDIGEGGDDVLQCTTDRQSCSYIVGSRTGQFIFPSGIQVPILTNVGSSGYYRTRGTQLISLHRQSENGVITGQFRCDIPSGTDTNSMLFIKIGM